MMKDESKLPTTIPADDLAWAKASVRSVVQNCMLNAAFKELKFWDKYIKDMDEIDLMKYTIFLSELNREFEEDPAKLETFKQSLKSR